MSKLDFALSVLAGVIAGFVVGVVATLSYEPRFTVTTFEPSAIQAPGPDYLQPADEQAVTIPAITCWSINEQQICRVS